MSNNAASFASGFVIAVSADQSTTFTAKATDVTGSSPCSQPLTYIEDSTPPVAPTGLGLSPGALANLNIPLVLGTAEAGSTVTLYTTSDCSGATAAFGSASTFSVGLLVNVADNSTTTFYATATDAAGNTSPCSSAVTYIEDSTPPATPASLSTTPASPANDNEPEIKGTAEADTTVKLYTTADLHRRRRRDRHRRRLRLARPDGRGRRDTHDADHGDRRPTRPANVSGVLRPR